MPAPGRPLSRAPSRVRATRGFLGAASLAVALASAADARAAEPQWNVGVVAGVAGTGAHRVWDDTAFAGALRADVLFARTGARSFGVGPALEVSTVGFGDVRGHAGASVLAPLGELFSITLTPALYGGSAHGGGAGVSGRALVGARAFVHGGGYALAGGLVLGVDRDLDRRGEHALVVALQVDAELVALPFMLLVSALRGPSDG